MFDELKEVKNRQIPGVLYSKEIWSLKGLRKAEVYLESKRVSMMELFCEYT